MAEIEERMPHFDPAKHTTEDVVRQDWEGDFSWDKEANLVSHGDLDKCMFVLYVIFLYLLCSYDSCIIHAYGS